MNPIKILILIFITISLSMVYANERDDLDDEDRVVVPASSSKDGIGNMLMQSISLIGVPYRWGGNTPETGMDCSAFIGYIFKKSLGINLPRTSAEIAKRGKKVSIKDLEPGDLLFFNTRRGPNTHLGMYIGNNKFIQSPRTGERIKITEFSGYYRQNFNGAKRIVQENEDEDGATTIESYHEINNQFLPGSYKNKKSYKRGKKSKRSSISKKSKSKAVAGKASKKQANNLKQSKSKSSTKKTKMSRKRGTKTKSTKTAR